MILIRTKKVHKPHNYFPDYHGILVDYLIVIWKKKKKVMYYISTIPQQIYNKIIF